jgi:hypothetical protein
MNSLERSVPFFPCLTFGRFKNVMFGQCERLRGEQKAAILPRRVSLFASVFAIPGFSCTRQLLVAKSEDWRLPPRRLPLTRISLRLGQNSRDLAGRVVDDHHIEHSVAVQIAGRYDRDPRGKSERENPGRRRELP